MMLPNAGSNTPAIGRSPYLLASPAPTRGADGYLAVLLAADAAGMILRLIVVPAVTARSSAAASGPRSGEAWVVG
jgi:hypothetical protein